MQEAIEKAQAAVDAWFGDMVLSLGPMISTEAYNHFAAQRDALKARIAAAVAAE